MMGRREEVYRFDCDIDPSDEPVSCDVTDDRVLEEEQERLVDILRGMRRRALSFTDDEAAEDSEEGLGGKAIKRHRRALRSAFRAAIDSIEDASTLEELDGLNWAATLDELFVEELPNTLGRKDLSKPAKLSETKKAKKPKPNR